MSAQTLRPDNGLALLESTLALCQASARDNIERAQAKSRNPHNDDDAAERAYKRAIAFLKVSAKLGEAMARVKGETHMTVRRIQTQEQQLRVEFPEPERPNFRTPPPRSEPPIDAATQARVNEIYEAWLANRAQTHGDVAAREPAANEDKAEGQGVPPSIFSGSNSGK
jgi:hypothetical protein